MNRIKLTLALALTRPLNYSRIMRTETAHPLADRLRTLLAARGVCTAASLRASLGLSQPSFSRLVAQMPDVERIDGGRATRWALRRAIPDLPPELPLYRITADGAPALAARLRLLEQDQVAVRPPGGRIARVVHDLPWFLEDARPAGFLGRLAPRLFPEFGFPLDIRLWPATDVLRFLALSGGDLPGDLVLGDDALRLAFDDAGPPRVPSADRAQRYPEIAADVLTHGSAGSSAAGEQPKFLVLREDSDVATSVLVKFSPPRDSATAERVGDLLVCEHLALRCLAQEGVPAAKSSLVFGAGRVFLEVERFDRVGRGRRGVASLAVLDGEFAGTAADWVTATQAVVRAGRIPSAAVADVRALQTFGQLIANTDMHLGNLSFWRTDDLLVARGPVVTGVAPAYDMLPMAYAPRFGELVDVDPPLPPPRPDQAKAHRLAAAFWQAVVDDDRVSPAFKAIAARWRSLVAARLSLYAGSR